MNRFVWLQLYLLVSAITFAAIYVVRSIAIVVSDNPHVKTRKQKLVPYLFYGMAIVASLLWPLWWVYCVIVVCSGWLSRKLKGQTKHG